MIRTLLAATALLALAPPAIAQTYAIQAGHLIVDAAKPARGPSTLIVEKGRIVRVEDGATAPAGATVVDMRGKTVLPGLIDVHVHLTMNAGEPWYQGLTTKYSEAYATTVGLRNALITARAGFTTVRDLGGGTDASLAMRDAVAEGGFPGPRILVSGPALSIIGGHGDMTAGMAPELRNAIDHEGAQFWVCTGAAECAKAVRKLAAAGVDAIKFHATGGVLDAGAMGLEQHFTDAEMKAICDTAHEMHRKCAAHAHGARGIEAAVRAGVDSIEHGTFADDVDVQLMKAKGTYFSATLMAFSGLNLYLGKGIFSPNAEFKARQTLDQWGKALGRAYKAGVKIALGTDAAVYPHGRNGEEIGLMVSKAGITPRDALIAATKGGADLLGLSAEIGTLDPGKSADLIAVDGDPLTDPAAVLHVGYVMVAGKPIPLQ
ncbi:amidohydrolase family protein [Sphingomonas gei]|uniref:Amidohydrolase family protein n=1 Tax=Sphingomonas gei TaxID=1395960 RepID=A0A4S1XDQ4_9SPHN|nr:amidohydrolase family protein [Sphingomonas gei]TGX53620.1 amidohydrolase family protein [Sphingomonas gei]